MQQLHCYVTEEVADLTRKDIGTRWPEGYFDLFGAWEGEALQRPLQGNYEWREVMPS